MPIPEDPPTPCPAAPKGPDAGPVPTDDDDGIHISRVTRIDRPFGPLLLVVVSWVENNAWVERTYELSD